MLGEASVALGAGTNTYNAVYSHTGSGGYGYDAAYNPTLYSYWNGNSGIDASLALPVNADNQIGLGIFGFDGAGNPTTYNSTAANNFAYDPEDRLTAISSPAFAAAYDGDGLRAWSSDGPGFPVNGGNTYYLDDGDRPVAEEASDSQDLFFSVFGAAGLAGRSREYAGAGADLSQVAYSAYTYDPQGSLVQPVSLYPEDGPLVRVETSSAFDAFGWGTTVAAGGSEDPYSPVGFGGQHGYYTDPETGLSLLTHRYYDAGAGRFVSRDPIGYKGGINLYGFAGNNPVNESDPSGFSGDSVLGGLIHGINDAAEGIAQTAEAGTSVLEAGTSLLEAGTHFAQAGVSATTNIPAAVASVAGAIVTSTYNQLRQRNLTERHHIIQNATVMGQPGYHEGQGLAVQRTGPSNDRTTPHGLTRIIQQQLGGGNFAAEVRIGYKALRVSGMQIHEARGHAMNAVADFARIGIGPGTTTTIPRDRQSGFRKGRRY